jgi:hypothetical protein
LAAVAATLLVGGIAAAKDRPEAPKEKKICQIETLSNSRIASHRVCRTKAEWTALAEESQQSARGAVEASNRRH